MSIENQLGAVSHEDWMRRALSIASKGMREDEVPIGAIVVYKNKIIGQGYNQCESLNDSTAHAEMLAITSASNTLGDWRLSDCTMYVTKDHVLCVLELLLIAVLMLCILVVMMKTLVPVDLN